MTIMSKQLPLIECPTCHGSGKAPLSETYASTLALFKRNELTAEQARVRSGETGVEVTAFNNRLRFLMELGFLTRRREGKFWLYSLQPKKKARK